MQRLTIFLQDVADRKGEETARQTKNVVSLILGLAVKRGVLPMNAAKSLGAIKPKAQRVTERDTERAFTTGELASVLAAAEERAAFAAEHRVAKTALKWEGVSDLIHFLAGTGVRIGEARGLQWADVDLQGRSVVIRGTKTDSSLRRLTLPNWLGERLSARADKHGQVGFVLRGVGGEV